MASLGDLIERCREEFGDPPRDLSRDDKAEFRLRVSWSMRCYFWRTRDSLQMIYRDQHILRDHGELVWGHIVQANQILFDRSNSQPMPACGVYSSDPYFDDRVNSLRDIGHELYELKGTIPDDPQLRRFARVITGEKERLYAVRIPRSLCENRNVYYTTFMVDPEHLPDGYLAAGYFPLLICPQRTDAVMILPACFWPRMLRDYWGEE